MRYCPRCQKKYEYDTKFCSSCGSVLVDSLGNNPLTVKNIEKASLFSLITFGIYRLYWLYQLIRNTRTLQKKTSSPIPEFLCFWLLPFYQYYWWLSRVDFVRDTLAKQGKKAVSNKYVFCLCSILGTSTGVLSFLPGFGLLFRFLLLPMQQITIISFALLQYDFNVLSESLDTLSPQSSQGPSLYGAADINITLSELASTKNIASYEGDGSASDAWTAEIDKLLSAQSHSPLRYGVQNIWSFEDESYILRFKTVDDAHNAMHHLQIEPNDISYKAWSAKCDKNIAVIGEKNTVSLILQSLSKSKEQTNK